MPATVGAGYGFTEDYRLPPGPRASVIVVGCLIILSSLWLIVRMGPGRRSSRLKHLSIRETTIAMAGATVVHALLMVGAGIANITANRYLSAAQATCIAVTMGASGVLSWERYLVVHPHYKPRHLTRALVHGYIFLVFSLPFLTSWVYLLIAKLQHTDQMTLDRPEDPASFTLLLATLLVFLGMPGRVFFDLILGISTMARIAELRRIIVIDVATAPSSFSSSPTPQPPLPTPNNDEQRQALLLLSIKIVVYLTASIVLNVAMHVHLPGGFHPALILIVGMGITFCFVYLTYFCFDSRASNPFACCFRGGAWRRGRQPQPPANNNNTRRNRAMPPRRVPLPPQTLEEGVREGREVLTRFNLGDSTKRHPMFQHPDEGHNNNNHHNLPSSVSLVESARIEMSFHLPSPSFASPATPMFKSPPLACVPEEGSELSSLSASSAHPGGGGHYYSGGYGVIGMRPDFSSSSDDSSRREESKGTARASSSGFYRMRDTILTSADLRPSAESWSLSSAHEESKPSSSSSGGVGHGRSGGEKEEEEEKRYD